MKIITRKTKEAMFNGINSSINDIIKYCQKAKKDKSISKKKLLNELGWEITNLQQAVGYWRVFL